MSVVQFPENVNYMVRVRSSISHFKSAIALFMIPGDALEYAREQARIYKCSFLVSDPINLAEYSVGPE